MQRFQKALKDGKIIRPLKVQAFTAQIHWLSA